MLLGKLIFQHLMSNPPLKWSITILVMLLTATVIILYLIKSPSPEEQLGLARQNITTALKANSGQYAQSSLDEATRLYDSAMTLWQLENERIFLFRNYDLTRSYAERAGLLAEASVKEINAAQAKLKSEVSLQISRMQDHLTAYQQRYPHIPLKAKQVSDLALGKILFDQARSAFQKENYPESKRKLDSASLLIYTVTTYAEHTIENYMKAFPEWNQWVNTTIEESRKQKKTCLVVDKYARTCQVYKNGRLQKTYTSELSSNWIGDKHHQGDKSTPEGIYRVVRKKAGTDTRYYKALLLDYPNEADKIRFAQNKKNGLIQPNAAIGGLIEVHGHGGKGTDWTDGCIALHNDDMDAVYDQCPVGTSIVIVGSLVPFQTLISSK